MGRSLISSNVFNILIDNLKSYGIGRVLIDGDGLYHLSEYLKNKKLSEGVSYIITPHFSEASRFMNKSVDEIKGNRYNSTIELSKMTSTVTLLKGPCSIISDGNNTLINTTGNSALATAGSGDILSGIIAALLLRDISPLEAAGIGAYLHGKAADLCVRDNNISILKATDILGYIRRAISTGIDK